MSKTEPTSDNHEQGNSSLGVVRVRCNRCKNEIDGGNQPNIPEETKTIVTSYCPKCDEGGDFCDEWYLDEEGNEL